MHQGATWAENDSNESEQDVLGCGPQPTSPGSPAFAQWVEGVGEMQTPQHFLSQHLLTTATTVA